jgi:hypothetical protein
MAKSRGESARLQAEEVLAEFPETACLRAPLINPVLKQQPLLSRDREGAVPFARFSRILQVPLKHALGKLKQAEACPTVGQIPASWRTLFAYTEL